MNEMRYSFYFCVFLFLLVLLTKCRLRESNAKKEGIVKEYYSNGKLESEINYKNGKIHGLLRAWHSNGQLYDSAYFENGEPIGYSVSYYQNGQKNFENYWNKNHQVDSVSRFWYEDGTLGSIDHNLNGQLHGEWRNYYPNGNLEFILNYKYGDQDGKNIYFKENGDTLRVEIYEKGKLLRSYK